MASRPTTIRVQYNYLHRVANGLTVLCFVVVIIASSLHGVGVIETVKRAFYVVVGINCLSWAAIKLWAAWDATHRGELR